MYLWIFVIKSDYAILTLKPSFHIIAYDRRIAGITEA